MKERAGESLDSFVRTLVALRASSMSQREQREVKRSILRKLRARMNIVAAYNTKAIGMR